MLPLLAASVSCASKGLVKVLYTTSYYEVPKSVPLFSTHLRNISSAKGGTYVGHQLRYTNECVCQVYFSSLLFTTLRYILFDIALAQKWLGEKSVSVEEDI